MPSESHWAIGSELVFACQTKPHSWTNTGMFKWTIFLLSYTYKIRFLGFFFRSAVSGMFAAGKWLSFGNGPSRQLVLKHFAERTVLVSEYASQLPYLMLSNCGLMLIRMDAERVRGSNKTGKECISALKPQFTYCSLRMLIWVTVRVVQLIRRKGIFWYSSWACQKRRSTD